MNLLKYTATYMSLVLVGVCCVGQVQAQITAANSNSFWNVDYDVNFIEGSSDYIGLYYLGPNRARLGTVIDAPDVAIGYYREHVGQTSDEVVALAERIAGFYPLEPYSRSASSVEVREQLIETPEYGSIPIFPYTMRVSTATKPGDFFIVLGMSAVAIARDPQPLFPALITTTLSLDAGSRIHSVGEDASASSLFEIHSSLLSEPILSIELQSAQGQPDATVSFGTSVDLGFSNPDTGAAMTAAELETLLESTDELWSDSPLSGPLRLVSVAYDLSDRSEADLVDQVFESIATSKSRVGVPEPSAAILLMMAAIVCGCRTSCRPRI